MNLREVYIFATMSRGGRLIGIKPGEQCDFSPLDSQYKGDFYGHGLIPHILAMDSQQLPIVLVGHENNNHLWHDVLNSIQALEAEKISDAFLIIKHNPGIEGIYGIDDTVAYKNAKHRGICIVNASRCHQALSKANILSEVAFDAGVERMPETWNYVYKPGDIYSRHSILNNVSNLKDRGTMVIKTPDPLGGSEVRIFHPSQIESELEVAFNIIRSIPIQIQDHIPGQDIQYEGKSWTGTSHIAWSILIGEDNGVPAICVYPHGGFYNLSQEYLPSQDGIKKTSSIRALFNAAKQKWENALEKMNGPSGLQRSVLMSADEFKREAELLRPDVTRLFQWLDGKSFMDFKQHFQTVTNDNLRYVARQHIADSFSYIDPNNPRLRGREIYQAPANML